jgi:hypothetical protein
MRKRVKQMNRSGDTNKTGFFFDSYAAIIGYVEQKNWILDLFRLT